MSSDIIKALQFRHACKVFNTDKRISQIEMEAILEAGRLAPSSFGLEQWQFVVVATQELKEQLHPLCFKQPQITSCSHLVAIAGRLDVKVRSPYLEQCLQRFGDNMATAKPMIEGFIKRLDDDSYQAWVAKQCYIAGAQMMVAAATMGIDSCPMEGFLPHKVHSALGLGSHLFIALLIPFGYRLEEPKRDKMRFALSDIVQYK